MALVYRSEIEASDLGFEVVQGPLKTCGIPGEPRG